MIYGLYRTLYGGDFIKESVLSVIDTLDKIFIFWSDTPRGSVSQVIYKGEKIELRFPFDDIIDKIKYLKNLFPNKVELIYDKGETDWNQVTYLTNTYILPNYIKPSILTFLEHDHIYKNNGFSIALTLFLQSRYQVATTIPLELWRTPLYYCFPIRKNRTCGTFWNMENLNILPPTMQLGDPQTGNLGKLDFYTHNLGFCMSERSMYWKHLITIANSKFSGNDGDSQPNPDWYDKWLNWEYDSPLNKNLEISLGYENQIECAKPYLVNELPEIIREKYKL
jgi:hypothetical protein